MPLETTMLPFTNQTIEIAQIIQLSVAPVFLLTGLGTILTVLTNRLARLVDRARKLEEHVDEDAAAQSELAAKLGLMARRARLINRAITLCTISALLVALVVVTLFLNTIVSFDLAAIIATLFILAMLALITALLLFLREVFLAVGSLRIGS